MSSHAEKVLDSLPSEWVDLREAAKSLPVHACAPMSKMLEDLERQGKVETRITGSPPKVQIRKAS